MFKTLSTAILATVASANSNYSANQIGVPPNANQCKTPAKLSPWGLIRDRDMGGCKCADDTAEWGPGNGLDEDWKCWCTIPDQYEARPAKKGSEKNNRACGVIVECQNAAVIQQKNMWGQEMSRLKKEKAQSKNINQKQLVKSNELNSVRHIRKQRTNQNRVRARVALQIIADQYKQVKLSFVSGDVSKEVMGKAHADAAAEVATIRQQWQVRQGQIDAYFENAVARTITMENFVDADQAKVDKYFYDKAGELKKLYGKRIQEIMMVPVIEDIYRKYAGIDSAVEALAAEVAGGKKITDWKLLREQNIKNCPLMQ